MSGGFLLSISSRFGQDDRPSGYLAGHT